VLGPPGLRKIRGKVNQLSTSFAMPGSNQKKIPVFWIFLALYGLYFLYFFHYIGAVPFSFWDEHLYLNAARAYLVTPKPYPIPDHPPFGKELIALGIGLFGDSPQGWRFFSVAFGALACTLVSYLVYRLTKRLGVSLFAGLAGTSFRSV